MASAHFHKFTESVPCFHPSDELTTDMLACEARIEAWEDMTYAAADFTPAGNARWAAAKQRFVELAAPVARGAA